MDMASFTSHTTSTMLFLLGLSLVTGALVQRFEQLARSSFHVNGKSIPNVSFDIGDTFAGMMPLDVDRKFFFWYMPAKTPNNKLTVWLNGGRFDQLI